MTNYLNQNSMSHKKFFVKNLIESFSFLCIEKLKNKKFFIKNKIIKKKKINFSNNASFLLNSILRKFILKYGEIVGTKISTQKRKNYNSIDLIENNIIKKFLPNIQEIFWRRQRKIFFLNIKNPGNKKKKSNSILINDEEKLYDLKDFTYLPLKNRKYTNCCRERILFKKKLNNLKFKVI